MDLQFVVEIHSYRGGLAVDLQFVVEIHSYRGKAGKTPVYKVSLKSKDGDTLTLERSDRSLWEEFPKDEIFDVKIGRGQRSIEEFTEEEG